MGRRQTKMLASDVTYESEGTPVSTFEISELKEEKLDTSPNNSALSYDIYTHPFIKRGDPDGLTYFNLDRFSKRESFSGTLSSDDLVALRNATKAGNVDPDSFSILHSNIMEGKGDNGDSIKIGMGVDIDHVQSKKFKRTMEYCDSDDNCKVIVNKGYKVLTDMYISSYMNNEMGLMKPEYINFINVGKKIFKDGTDGDAYNVPGVPLTLYVSVEIAYGIFRRLEDPKPEIFAKVLGVEQDSDDVGLLTEFARILQMNIENEHEKFRPTVPKRLVNVIYNYLNTILNKVVSGIKSTGKIPREYYMDGNDGLSRVVIYGMTHKVNNTDVSYPGEFDIFDQYDERVRPGRFEQRLETSNYILLNERFPHLVTLKFDDSNSSDPEDQLYFKRYVEKVKGNTLVDIYTNNLRTLTVTDIGIHKNDKTTKYSSYALNALVDNYYMEMISKRLQKNKGDNTNTKKYHMTFDTYDITSGYTKQENQIENAILKFTGDKTINLAGNLRTITNNLYDKDLNSLVYKVYRDLGVAEHKCASDLKEVYNEFLDEMVKRCDGNSRLYFLVPFIRYMIGINPKNKRFNDISNMLSIIKSFCETVVTVVLETKCSFDTKPQLKLPEKVSEILKFLDKNDKNPCIFLLVKDDFIKLNNTFISMLEELISLNRKVMASEELWKVIYQDMFNGMKRIIASIRNQEYQTDSIFGEIYLFIKSIEYKDISDKPVNTKLNKIEELIKSVYLKLKSVGSGETLINKVKEVLTNKAFIILISMISGE